MCVSMKHKRWYKCKEKLNIRTILAKLCLRRTSSLQLICSTTGTCHYLGNRFCRQFPECSSCLTGQQGSCSKTVKQNILQNLLPKSRPVLVHHAQPSTNRHGPPNSGCENRRPGMRDGSKFLGHRQVFCKVRLGVTGCLSPDLGTIHK